MIQEKVFYKLTVTINQFDTPFRGPFDLVSELMCVLRDWGVQQSDYDIRLEVTPGEK